MSKRPRAESRNSLSPNSTFKSNIASADTTPHPAATAKYTHLDSALFGEPETPNRVMHCALAPHRQPVAFDTFEEYDAHYRKEHVNRCSECRRNLPSEHFLNLHISERHDPIRETRQERGERTYACFVEGCDRVCSTPYKRRLHLIDKHQYPRNYDFWIVNYGIDRRTSMLRPEMPNRRRGRKAALKAKEKPNVGKELRPSAAAQPVPENESDNDSTDDSNNGVEMDRTSDEAESEASDESVGQPEAAVLTPTTGSTGSPKDRTTALDPMDGLANSMSSLRFVPPSIRFGRGRGKAGFARR